MKFIRLIYAVLALALAHNLNAQGLRFVGMEDKIESRTSFEVFESRQPTFKDVLRIEFELAVYPPSDFGYILRVKNEEENRVFNLLYSGPGWDEKFPLRLNEEGRSSIIKADIPRDYFKTNKWMSILLEFNLLSGEVTLKVDDFVYSTVIEPLSSHWKTALSFGKSDYFIDVPTFAIRDLRISDDSRSYVFPLNETEGNVVHESRYGVRGRVNNPEWLLDKAYKWTLAHEFSSSKVAGVNYDPIRRAVLYYNSDSVYTYDVSRREASEVRTNGRCPVNLFLARSFVNPYDSMIYMYEAVEEESGGSPVPKLASYDPVAAEWKTVGFDAVPIHFHHHSSYLDVNRSKFVIFGGFGDMIYNGNFYSCDLSSWNWTREEDLEGATIFPRYFTSIGYSSEKDEVYVFGGMGNECGEQVVGRHYYYDLHRIDLEKKECVTLWNDDLVWKEENMVPVRDMIIDGNGFYTVCYPEFLTNSYLQLYHFDIEGKSYQKLCDRIPIRSDKMATNANVYYDKELSTLILTVQESADDISSHLKIYTLAYPPLTEAEFSMMSRKPSRVILIVVIAMIVLAAGCVIYLHVMKTIKRKEGVVARDQSIKRHIPEDRNNSLCLFGGFTALDPDGLPIQFSAQQRKLLLLIIKYNLENGLSSRRMTSILWPDKSEEKAKNSRGVTLNHLRSLLKKFDGVTLVYDDNHFKLDFGDNFYCDWFEFKTEISSEKPDINRLISLTSRGKFMHFTDDPVFDSFKEKTETALINLFTSEMENMYGKKAYFTVVELAEIVLVSDPLNEQALIWLVNALVKLKRSDDAMVKYSAYAAEYLSAYGSVYDRKFKSLLM